VKESQTGEEEAIQLESNKAKGGGIGRKDVDLDVNDIERSANPLHTSQQHAADSAQSGA